MEERVYALFGVFGPLLVYASIVLSLVLSPWFSWQSNALSDLGHAVTSDVAPIFNLGLLLAGFFLMVYALTAFKKHAKYSSLCLLVSTFLVQLLATFNEVYCSLHYAAAVPHFLMLSLTSIVYTVEKRSAVALTTFVIVMFSWLLYALNIFSIGIAVPETVSKLVLAWIMYSAIKIYFDKEANTL
ncbi:MAG TPA: DUF998 domain-containing protein [Candidatus Bathyarchaeota archaeon]|nr:DUF998 domain-containing protein [Candidatus Bathyarchaeota archaeon]